MQYTRPPTLPGYTPGSAAAGGATRTRMQTCGVGAGRAGRKTCINGRRNYFRRQPTATSTGMFFEPGSALINQRFPRSLSERSRLLQSPFFPNPCVARKNSTSRYFNTASPEFSLAPWALKKLNFSRTASSLRQAPRFREWS